MTRLQYFFLKLNSNPNYSLIKSIYLVKSELACKIVSHDLANIVVTGGEERVHIFLKV